MQPAMSLRRRPGIASLMVLMGTLLAASALSACRVNAATADGALTATAADAKSLLVSNSNGGVEIVRDPSATTMQVSAKIRCVAE